MKPFTFSYAILTFVAWGAVVFLSTLFGIVISTTGIAANIFESDPFGVTMVWVFALSLGVLAGAIMGQYGNRIYLIPWTFFVVSMPLAFMAGLGALAPWMIHIGNFAGFFIGMTVMWSIGILLRKDAEELDENPQFI